MAPTLIAWKIGQRLATITGTAHAMATICAPSTPTLNACQVLANVGRHQHRVRCRW